MPQVAELVGALSAPGLPPTYGVEAERLAAAAAAAERALGATFAHHTTIGRTRDVPAAADAALAWLSAQA